MESAGVPPVECVNVRVCPRERCGAELCDTHQPVCLYCALHDEHGFPLPKDEHPHPRLSWWSQARNLIEFKIIHASVCAVFGHRWWSMPVVGHGGGPIIYYGNHCRRCYGPSSKSASPYGMREDF
jgi:hypothetical protein